MEYFYHNLLTVFLCIFFSGKKQQVLWIVKENKPKPWQSRNLQKYNKKKQEYDNK